MFTVINIEQSLHVCKRVLVISIGLPSWFKTEIFPTLQRNQLPHPPRIENVPNRDTSVSYRTEP